VNCGRVSKPRTQITPAKKVRRDILLKTKTGLDLTLTKERNIKERKV
jgi:hypothetical protein